MGTKSKRATSTNNLLYGKVIIYFAPLEGGVNKGEIDLGEAPSFSVQPMTDKLERFASREGFKKKIFEGITEVGAQCKFVLIEYNLENINLAFLGSGNVPVSQSSGQLAGEQIPARLDRWVKLPHRNISNITVTGHTENTDYKVDYDLGRIMAREAHCKNGTKATFFMAYLTQHVSPSYSAPCWLIHSSQGVA